MALTVCALPVLAVIVLYAPAQLRMRSCARPFRIASAVHTWTLIEEAEVQRRERGLRLLQLMVTNDTTTLAEEVGGRAPFDPIALKYADDPSVSPLDSLAAEWKERAARANVHM